MRMKKHNNHSFAYRKKLTKVKRDLFEESDLLYREELSCKNDKMPLSKQIKYAELNQNLITALKACDFISKIRNHKIYAQANHKHEKDAAFINIDGRN